MSTDTERGFSLLELMIAALLTVGLMGVIFAISNQQQRVFVTEVGVVDMNQNARTAVDMLTRDMQTAGMGLPYGLSNFASIFYVNGASGAPDSLMMLNGDPFAPTTEVESRPSGSAEFYLLIPPDVTITGVSPSQAFTYVGYEKKDMQLYKEYSSDPRWYTVYDAENAMMFTLSKDGETTGTGAAERLKLQNNPTSYMSPASVFGATIGTAEPNYAVSKVAVLSSAVGYRLNTNTGELLRTEDLTNWYPVARGIRNFQVQYRLVRRNTAGVIEESITESPGNGVDKSKSGELTSRSDIHSVIITLEAETPDYSPDNQSYRRVVHRFEVTPRNLNLVNRNNIYPDTESE